MDGVSLWPGGTVSKTGPLGRNHSVSLAFNYTFLACAFRENAFYIDLLCRYNPEIQANVVCFYLIAPVCDTTFWN
jgi:hypothetical protein